MRSLNEALHALREQLAVRRRLTRLPGTWIAPLQGPRPKLAPKYIVWSFLSSAFGIVAIALLAEHLGHPLLVGSFGASAVLLFGASESPLTQPRNLIGGHVLCASVAVVVVALFGTSPLTLGLAVGLSLLLMNLTHTTHPPGGGTALIGVQGAVGPSFIVLPVLAGALILLATALFTNNVVYHRKYPNHWL